MNPIWNMARKEFSDGLRNRWLLAISLLFAILAIGLYLGARDHRQPGQPGNLPDAADCLVAGL
jgi:Cu-processing system permease protein